MLGLLGIVIIVNTVLGIVLANKNDIKFDWKILLKGLVKAIVIVICILLFCVTLELVPIVLLKIGIEVPEELITTLEIVITTFTAYKKYALDCLDKFKKLLNIEAK